MEAGNAGRLGEAPPAAAGERMPAVASVPPWYRRVAFWRAVAGMAFAVAIACAMVAAEFSSTLLARTRHYHNRLHQLSSNLTAMRGEIASADREIADMRNAAEVRDGLTRIIAAADARLIRLAAPVRASAPIGVIAFSPGLRRAAVEITGLPVISGGRVYTLWWTCGKRRTFKAARIVLLGATDKAALLMTLPPIGETIEGAMVTTDSQPSIAKPSGEIVLRGAVALTPARVESPRHKSS